MTLIAEADHDVTCVTNHQEKNEKLIQNWHTPQMHACLLPALCMLRPSVPCC